MAGQVPTAEQVIGFPLGERDVTVAESDAYLQAVAEASPEVVAGTAGTSAGPAPALRHRRPPGNVTPAGLARIRLQTALLRDPRTPASVAAHLARTTPAILWVAATSTAARRRAAPTPPCRVLYSRPTAATAPPARSSTTPSWSCCRPRTPTAREAGTPQRLRLRPQPRLVRPHPAQDRRQAPAAAPLPAGAVHRRPRDEPRDLLLPPNADPIYHEITDESVDWINNLYGAAMADEFTRQGIPFFNRDVYDLFYMGYGDTVPSTGFIAAGMTFEKASGDPDPAAGLRAVPDPVGVAVLGRGQPRRHPGPLARRLGRGRRPGAGRAAGAQRDRQPRQRAGTQVPERPLRHWFLRADDPTKARELRAWCGACSAWTSRSTG